MDVYIKWHLFGDRVRWDSLMARSNLSRGDRCSSYELENTTMSSMYTRVKIHKYGARIPCMTRWKMEGPLRNPKGILLNCHRPRWVRNAVFSLSSSAKVNWVKPLSASSIDRTCAPDMACMISVCLGRGNSSGIVREFNFL